MKPTPAQIDPHPYNKFLHANPMSKGGLGKSVEAELRSAWLLARGIDWRGSDMDDRHKTFSARHPGRVNVLRSESPEEAKEAYMTVFRSILYEPHPVHVVDSRAQGDQFFADAVEQYNFLGNAAELGVRLTLFVFPTDEMETMENLGRLVRLGTGRANFVIVENPARSTGKLFRNSAFEKTLLNMGSKTIRLPIISSPTMIAMEGVEHKLKRGISFAEFASRESGHLNPLMVAELQYVLTQMYSRYDAIADVLLPASLAAKVRPTNVGKDLKEETKHDSTGFELNFGS